MQHNRSKTRIDAGLEREFAEWHATEWMRLRDMATKIAPENVPVMDSVRGLVRNVAWDAYKAATLRATSKGK